MPVETRVPFTPDVVLLFELKLTGLPDGELPADNDEPVDNTLRTADEVRAPPKLPDNPAGATCN